MYEGAKDEDGEAHGRGSVVYEDGSVFSGHFRHGQRSGNGTLRHPDGSFLTGNYVNDELTGIGVSFDPEVCIIVYLCYY